MRIPPHPPAYRPRFGPGAGQTDSSKKEGRKSNDSSLSQFKHKNQAIRLPSLNPGVCSGLILSGASYPDLRTEVSRRRTYQGSPLLSVIAPDPCTETVLNPADWREAGVLCRTPTSNSLPAGLHRRQQWPFSPGGHRDSG